MKQQSRRLLLAGAAGLLLLSVLACSLSTPLTPSATPTLTPPAVTNTARPATAPTATLAAGTFVCDTAGEATEADQLHATDYTGEAFNQVGWKKRTLLRTNFVEVIWNNDEQAAVAYLYYQVFGCPYTAADLTGYYNDQFFIHDLFSGYTQVSETSECKADEVALYEFTGDYEDTHYLMRFWIVAESDTQLLTLALAMPDSQPQLLQEYAAAVFPDLSVCPGQ